MQTRSVRDTKINERDAKEKNVQYERDTKIKRTRSERNTNAMQTRHKDKTNAKRTRCERGNTKRNKTI
jgi:hypothetical protein